MKNIPEEVYTSLIEAKKNNKYANHICNSSCGVGSINVFKVKNTDITVKLKCTQKGGMWSGNSCFILTD